MSNPWLAILESDYVGHMSSPEVDQRAVLNRLFRAALERTRPGAVLVAGASTGNGLEHVVPGVTARVTAVDINPAFLRRLAETHANAGFVLDLRCADLETCALDRRAYDLVHAALVLEYVDWPAVLPRLAASLAPGGTLSVVIQTPSASTPAVTPTAFASLRTLESIFHFVDVDELVAAAGREQLAVRDRWTERLPGDKAFEVLRFAR